MIFARQPFEKKGDKYKIPCFGAENGFATVDLIINEDSAKFTDNINVTDGAFTIVDHDTEKERTVYPFNNFGKWIWAENAEALNKAVASEITNKIRYYKIGEKVDLNILNEGEIQHENFFYMAEQFAIENPIFNVASFNELLGYNEGKNPLENIPGPIVGAAFSIWLKFNQYDKRVNEFIEIMRKW